MSPERGELRRESLGELGTTGTELWGKPTGDPSAEPHNLLFLTGKVTWRCIGLSCTRHVPILPLTPCAQPGSKLVRVWFCVLIVVRSQRRENCGCLRNG